MNSTRVGLYVRVSTQEQVNGYSIGEQIERLQKYAQAHNWTVINTYVDAGLSGSNMERPALQEMIADVQAHRIDKVIVYKLDRLSRSQKDTLKIIEDILLANNCDFESMTERFDTSTSFGKAIVGILAVFSQLEREQIKERMIMGTSARIKEGKWRGGAHVPFGYRYDHDKNMLETDEYEAMVVRHIFESYKAGRSVYWIRNDLTQKGYTIHGKIDGRRIDYILKNRTYCGYQLYNGEWFPAAHEAIIDEDTYEKAQSIIAEKKKRYDESGARNGIGAVSTHLAGIVFCARCGARYSKYTTGNKKSGIHINYGCYSKHKKVPYMIKDPNCRNKSYRVEELDTIIFNEIKKLKIDPDYVKMVKQATDNTGTAQRIHATQAQIKTITAQVSRFMDLYGTGIFTVDELDEKTKPLISQREKLQAELERLQKETQVTAQQVNDMIESFEEALKYGDLQQRRTIIESLIKRIDIDGEQITIHWNFQ